MTAWTSPDRVAFVLSGGASLGAVQVGMAQALEERGVRPDLIVGASVGALNGAWMSARGDRAGLEELARVWTSLKRGDVFPLRPLTGLFGFLGRSDHLVNASGLERLLRRHLPFERLEDAPIPLHVVATEVTTGLEVTLTRGDAVQAIVASAAIPGVYPPVRIDGRDLMDGGVIDNTPVSVAVAAGAEAVYVLPTGYACALHEAPRSALGVALQALTLLIDQRLAADIARYENRCDLHVIPPLCPLSVPPVDFGHAAELIERSRAAAHEWLDKGKPAGSQADLLSFHRHGHGRRDGHD